MDNQRLVLFLVLFFSLFMLWQGWQKQGVPAPGPVATSSTNAPASSGQVSAPVPVPSADTIPASQAMTAAPAAVAPTMTVTTDLFVAEISAQGGDLVRLELRQHRATEDHNQNFVLFEAKHAYAAQSGLIGPGLPNHKSVWQLPAQAAELKDGEQELRIKLNVPAADGVSVSKTYVFKRGSYLVDLEYDIANGGTEPMAPHAYFQLTRDGKAPDDETKMMSTFTGPAFYTEAEKFHKVTFEDIGKGKAKVPASTDNGWVAMIQHYFVSAWLPGSGPREFFARETSKDQYAAGVIVPMTAIAPGTSGKLSVPLFAGPQEQDKLAAVAPGFDLVVDYGWLTIVAAPIFWALQWIHSFIGNWGWSIILLTVALKAAFFPLSAASYKSMAKMRVLTPKLQKLKDTYGDDKQRLNQEMMEMYKKEKVNPLGGCLPILVQIPVFIALYWVLMGTVEMRGTPWLGWITDLSTKDPYFILPLIMGATMLIQTKLNPAPPDPMQAKIMMMMPIIFTGMFLFFPSGLVLYWTVNNVLSIAQQWQVNRMIEASGLKAK